MNYELEDSGAHRIELLGIEAGGCPIAGPETVEVSNTVWFLRIIDSGRF
jgi:hypothetical protein